MTLYRNRPKTPPQLNVSRKECAATLITLGQQWDKGIRVDVFVRRVKEEKKKQIHEIVRRNVQRADDGTISLIKTFIRPGGDF